MHHPDPVTAACQPPRRPRVPLWAGAALIGSVEPDLLALLPAPVPVSRVQRDGVPGWQVEGDVTASLAQVALALQGAGLAHTWRDEQLAVNDEHGNRLGTVERAVVRPLGITTYAVHLAATAPDGRHWVQQRSLSKPNDPGLWDTLMGGMVPASDTLEQALERETWEEAGLRMDELSALAWGGRIATRRPAGDGQDAGYVVEHIDWYRCMLADGVVPANRDGEVEQFALLEHGGVREKIAQGQFTIEAALVLSAAGV
jgi:8-oxo-dGTP pyrophosphatase MutT (NUDIX family)